MQSRLFDPNSPTGQTLRGWWEGLEKDKGGRAALRRCDETVEVLFVPAYHGLYLELRKQLDKPDELDRARLPAVAGLLAHVRQTVDSQDLPKQMATPRKGASGPPLSELRFRRLLQCRNRDELFPVLRRAVHLLDDRVNIYSLAASVYFWGDKVRKNWAYAYYGQLKD